MHTTNELPQHYDAHASRAKYYPQWEAQEFFKANPEHPGKPYSIMMPPPNVTGALHMGHALNNTLQDLLARYHRMTGHSVVWVPGTDHASIAVHWLIEKQLKAEGTNRHELGREAFMERAWAFKEDHGNTIFQQLRTLGVSCDFSRTRFTLDEGLSHAVRDVFVRLYRDGLIYRAERLVNWDCVTQTTLSDLEVLHDENVQGELFHFAYTLDNNQGEIVVATTRPETMLGDTAIAVHPNDERYKHLIGTYAVHPFVDRKVLIVADAILVDPAFGTGAVKITPAHDFNDFEVGQRHNLPMINILNKNGTLNHECGEFTGLDRFAARNAVKQRLEELGFARGTTPHTLNIGKSERSGTIVEPMLSTQWYVRTKPLAAPSLAAVEHGFMQFVPDGWKNTYYAWLRDIKDWCISRQLWWGHQIPAWYCQACNHLHVATSMPEACEACEHTNLKQDEDILDTWFSSALWPFSTLGWPEQTADLKTWYPTSVLITSFDIIFFWVARMMMFGQYFMGQVPFKDVYIHPLVRDSKGEKMSKTKGNVVNPLVMIEQYGCDAFRFTLIAFSAQGRDMRWDESRASGYQKFCNKIWQAFRFTMSFVQPTLNFDAPKQTYDQWILYRLDSTITHIRQSIEEYRFNDSASALYTFIWDDLCDWYLELVKPTLYAEGESPAKDAVRTTLLTVFETLAKLMHPMMPFLSEELWQYLPHTTGSIMQTQYPEAGAYAHYASAAHETEFVKNLITAVRRIRSEYTIAPKVELQAVVQTTPEQFNYVQQHQRSIENLAKCTFTLLKGSVPAKSATEIFEGAQVFVPLEGIIDLAVETKRLQKEIAKAQSDLDKVNKQLSNADFMARAPADIVQEKHEQIRSAQERYTRYTQALERLGQ